MKNKLAYLGFIGLLGFGGFVGNPLLFFFFGYFSFFSYAKVIPDELFWANVRYAATRAFFALTASSSILICGALLVTQYHNRLGIGILLGGMCFLHAVCEGIFLLTMSALERGERQGKAYES